MGKRKTLKEEGKRRCDIRKKKRRCQRRHRGSWIRGQTTYSLLLHPQEPFSTN
jgi:hypothetical protein